MSELGARRGLDLRSGPQMREYAAIADRIASDRPGRILDWGCGYGQVTALMRERGLDVTPFEHREDARVPGLERLERYPEIEAHVSSEPVRLPFADDRFDSVLSLGVLEHVERPEDSLDELRRVLRPGGTLYVYKLPNRFSYLERIAGRLGLYSHGTLPFDTLYDLRSARAIVERHGFVVHEARWANMLPLTIAWAPLVRLAGIIWALNRLLARVPGLNRLATNVEVVATSADPRAT